MAKRLTQFILVALVLGVIAGWAINAAIDDGTPASAAHLKEIADYLSIVTAVFLRLIKMIIAPLVFATLVAGIAHMGDVAALGRIGVRSLAWFILASLVSLTLGLILVNTLQPGVGLNLPLPPATAASGVETAAFNLKDFVTHLVPASIFESMAKNEILPIVIFSLFFGVALTAVGDAGKPLVRGDRSPGAGDAAGHQLRHALCAARRVHRGDQRASPSADRRSSPPSASSSAASISGSSSCGACWPAPASCSSARGPSC